MIKNTRYLEKYSQAKFNNIPMMLVVSITGLAVDSFYVTGGEGLTEEINEILKDNYDEEVEILLLYS